MGGSSLNLSLATPARGVAVYGLWSLWAFLTIHNLYTSKSQAFLVPRSVSELTAVEFCNVSSERSSRSLWWTGAGGDVGFQRPPIVVGRGPSTSSQWHVKGRGSLCPQLCPR